MISDLSLWVSTFNWEPVELSGFFSVLNYILEVSIPLCWVHWESLWGAESEPTAAASDWPRAPSEQKQWIFLKMRKVIKILSGICGAWLLGAGRRKCVHPQQPLHHRQSAGQTAGQVVPVTDTCQCPHVSYCRADSCLFETTAHTDSSVLVTLDKNNEIGELKHSKPLDRKGFLILFFLFSVSGPE